MSYIVAHHIIYSLKEVCRHVADFPVTGQIVNEQLVLTGRLENLLSPLKQIKALPLKPGSQPQGKFSLNKSSCSYQISIAIEDLEIDKPLTLKVLLPNGKEHTLAEFFLGEAQTIVELLPLAQILLQTNDFATCRKVCEKILATHLNNKAASALSFVLFYTFLDKKQSLITIKDTYHLLLALNLAHEVFDYEEIAKLAKKYQQRKIEIIYWDKCISRSSQIKVEWLIAKGEALLALKKYSEAETFFNAVIAHVQNFSFGYGELGYALQLQQKWNAAIPYWDFCIQHFSHEKGLVEDWLMKKNEAYLALGQIEPAKLALQHAIQISPNFIESYNKLIELEIKESNWDKALEYCNVRIEAFPTTSKFYNELWNLLKEQRRLNDAIQQYQTESTQKPQNLSLQIRLAGVLELQGKLEDALEAYQQVKLLQKIPDWVHQRYVNVLIDLGELQEAEIELYQRFAKPGQRIELLTALARLATRSQQFELAIERWQELRNLEPKYLNIWVNEANALISLNRFEKAKTIFEQLARDYPDNRIGEENLARLAVRQRNFEVALVHCEACIIKEPNNLGLQVAKADILVMLNQLAEAKVIYEQFFEQFPNDLKGLHGLAKIARLSGDFELCLDYCQQLIKRFPGVNVGYQEAEQAHIELGQFEQATQMVLTNPTTVHKQSYKKAVSINAFLPKDLILPEMVGKNNDYTFIEEKVKQFIESKQPYILPVSIIIPVYNRKVLLAKTLAALTHQTYPKELIEIVVADDGSSDGVEEVIEKYKQLFDLQYIFQADEGFRLSAVRNLGMRTAKYNHFIILDCDILPVPQLVEAYMKYFHVSDRVAMTGLRRFVCSDGISDDEILQDAKVFLELPDIKSSNDVAAKYSTSGVTHDWRLPMYTKNDYGKKQKWSFIGFVGGNAAHSKKAIDEVGSYDEAFQAWGREDNEIGYRIYNAGYYFIPVKDALGLHQEPIDNKEIIDRKKGLTSTDILLEEKCPSPSYRKYQKGRLYQVPKVSIYIPAYNAAKYIKEAIDSALNQTYTDLEVCVCDDGSIDNTLQILEENYANNPRVRWISQPNGGIGKASNTAVRFCRGMYVGQLDADDFLKPHAVELAVNYLDNYDVGCVYSSPEIVDAEGNFVKLGHSKPFSREGLLYGMIVGHFRFFRKRDWMRTAGFNEELTNAVDFDMFLKLAEVCDFHHLDDANYCYRWHGENTSVVKRKQQEANHFIAINHSLQRMGLHEWEAVQADTSRPRSVKLQRKKDNDTIFSGIIIFLHKNSVDPFGTHRNSVSNYANGFMHYGYKPYFFELSNPEQWLDEFFQLVATHENVIVHCEQGHGLDLVVQNPSTQKPELLANIIKKPIISHIRDYPYVPWVRYKISYLTNYHRIYHTDQLVPNFLEKTHGQKEQHRFFPHVYFDNYIDSSLLNIPPSKREIELLYVGSYREPEQYRQNFLRKYPNWSHLFSELVDKAMDEYHIPMWDIAHQLCLQSGGEYFIESKERFLDLLFQSGFFVRWKRKEKFLEQISKHPLTLVWSGPLPVKNFHPKTKIIQSMPLEQTLDTIARSRAMIMCLNNFTDSLSERLLSAMARGTVVLTNTNTLIESSFKKFQEILIYNEQMSDIDEQLSIVYDEPKHIDQIAENARKKVLSSYSSLKFAEQVLKDLQLLSQKIIP